MLFSEPKIPQYINQRYLDIEIDRFSALQRAENSSIQKIAERTLAFRSVSVLFSEPKIPQW